MQKLGEYLKQAGAIDEEQLERALQAQVIYGGSLGTNLIESGLVSEDQLVDFLSRYYEVPRLDLKHAPQPDAATLLGSEIASRSLCVPLFLEGRRLHVAMANPGDLQGIADIEFATGKMVVAYVASEARIRLLLEQVYDIPRELRYLSVRLKKDVAEANQERELTDKHHGRTFHAVAKIEPIKAILPKEEIEEAAGVAPSLVYPPPIEWPAPAKPMECQVGTERLRLARTRNDIARIVLTCGQNFFHREVMLAVRHGVVHPWAVMSQGAREGEAKMPCLMLSLDDDSIFKTVYDTNSPYLGPISENSVNNRFLQWLGGARPNTIALLPIVIAERSTILLYGDCKDAEPPDDLSTFVRFMREAETMFEVLIRRRKFNY